jgi:chorismate dehydratase
MATLGVVPYLNALPLYRPLETSGTSILRVVPAQLCTRLDNGECDAAIMPVFDYFRGVGESIISDACIGCDGPVRSVLMFHRGPVEQLKRVAVDSSSHSSVALLRVLLVDAYGVQPEFITHPPDLPAMLKQADAALLIGDKALEAALEYSDELNVFDLGEEWKKLTGLPFVFAAWISRRGLPQNEAAELGRVLSLARDKGLQNLPQIVYDNPIETRLSPAQVEDYLRHAVSFYLTDDHRSAIEEFERRCQQYNLV